MESAELVDMMINGASPSEMQDAVKDLLILKAADKVDEMAVLKVMSKSFRNFLNTSSTRYYNHKYKLC